MTKKEAIEILDKELKCYRIDISACDNRHCEECENAVSSYDVHLAIEVALDILKKGETDGQKGEKSTAKDQAAEQLYSPGETVEGSHPGNGS